MLEPPLKPTLLFEAGPPFKSPVQGSGQLIRAGRFFVAASQAGQKLYQLPGRTAIGQPGQAFKIARAPALKAQAADHPVLQFKMNLFGAYAPGLESVPGNSH
jgi:hypothetical protein